MLAEELRQGCTVEVFLGLEMLQGAEAAVEAINSRGGLLGKNVELIVKDDACNINHVNCLFRYTVIS